MLHRLSSLLLFSALLTYCFALPLAHAASLPLIDADLEQGGTPFSGLSVGGWVLSGNVWQPNIDHFPQPLLQRFGDSDGHNEDLPNCAFSMLVSQKAELYTPYKLLAGKTYKFSLDVGCPSNWDSFEGAKVEIRVWDGNVANPGIITLASLDIPAGDIVPGEVKRYDLSYTVPMQDLAVGRIYTSFHALGELPHVSFDNLSLEVDLSTAEVTAYIAASTAPVDDGYRPTMRLNAVDEGVIFRHGEGPDQCDMNGAREPTIIVENDTYFLFYDGGGPRGWLACLATSKDLRTWTRHGPVLDFGAPGEPDAGSALSPWFIKEGDTWHMYYVTAENNAGPPGFLAAGPYNSGHARSKSLMGPWVKTKNYVPVKSKPEGQGYPQGMAYPGHVVKKDNGEYLMFYGGLGGIGIARTRDLTGEWVTDPTPFVDKHFHIENSSVYYEPANKTWFLFVNHINSKDGYTDSTWVFWSNDLEKWSSDQRAIALDGENSNWAERCFGMATVTQIGERLALVYDAAPGQSTSHLGRDIGLAWYDLPLTPPKK